MTITFVNWAAGALADGSWATNAWNVNIAVAPAAGAMVETGATPGSSTGVTFTAWAPGSIVTSAWAPGTWTSSIAGIGTVWASGALAAGSWVANAWANATLGFAPAAASMVETGATPSVLATTFTWYALPAPGAYDSNSLIYGQTFPTGSLIREVTAPAHIISTNYAIGPLANDVNDYMVAQPLYTGADSGVYEIKTPAGATSQYTATFSIGAINTTVSPSAASMTETGATPGVAVGFPPLTPAPASMTETGATPNVIFDTNFFGAPSPASMRMTGVAPDIAISQAGRSTGPAVLSGASSMSDDADYALLAANDLRQFIQTVPGSGPIRGVWVYKDLVYVFRDNIGATAGLMYVESASGWTLVTMPYELQFVSFGTTPPAWTVGTVITNGTATATIAAILVRTGSWAGSNAVGSLVLSAQTGTFANADPIKIGATQFATATAASTARIVRLPGGRMEFENNNFTGSTLTKKMYGVDGVNPCFEFDGTTYVPIRTGMVLDAPSHIRVHRQCLFLSFLGSVQISGPGTPYVWTVVLGAAEIALGDDVTGMVPNSGSQAAGSAAGSSALSIFTTGRTSTLYGSSPATFNLVTANVDMGYSPFTCQLVSNNVYGMTARGLQSLITTLTYGDFDYVSVSHPIQPIMDSKRGLEISSTTLHKKNQYRVYFSDGSGITVGLTGDKISGLMPLNYGKAVRCICTANLSTGAEVTYFGSDDGYVYRDNIGTSFDGGPIESWLRTQFNNEKSPRVRKTYKHAVLEVKVDRYCEVNISYDLGYGNPDVLPSAQQADSALKGPGGYWDSVIWDNFTWDTQSVLDPQIDLTGTEKNLSLLFYSNRAQDLSHILEGVNIMYIPRRIQR